GSLRRRLYRIANGIGVDRIRLFTPADERVNCCRCIRGSPALRRLKVNNRRVDMLKEINNYR
ncbi:MAG: hypothetical protein ABI822_17655, partial [Bryobacteraceae bacterium]